MVVTLHDQTGSPPLNHLQIRGISTVWGGIPNLGSIFLGGLAHGNVGCLLELPGARSEVSQNSFYWGGVGCTPRCTQFLGEWGIF